VQGAAGKNAELAASASAIFHQTSSLRLSAFQHCRVDGGEAEDHMNDRRRGALIGLAVGDAMGAAVEFSC